MPVLAILLLLTTCGSATAQNVLRVDASAPAGGDGSSWATAYGDLKLALAAAALTPGPDEIWVAAGTYRPGSVFEPDRTVSFVLPGDVQLLGGFAGDEAAAGQRDPMAHPTILSGDLWNNDLPAWLQRLDNSLHIVTARDLAAPSAVDGFTFTGGNADFPPAELLGGGAIFAERADLTIRRCFFTENTTGMREPALGNFGGAVYMKDAGSLVVEDCRFTRNRAQSGGAIATYGVSGPLDLTIAGCTFQENLVPTQSGGAVRFAVGGPLLIESCAFEDNRAGYGGAIRSTLAREVVIRDCEFLRNIADSEVAAVLLDRSDDHNLVPALIEGCRFADNRCEFGYPDGAIYLLETITHMTDCEVTGNYNAYLSPISGIHGASTIKVELEAGHRFVNCLVADNFAGLAGGVVLDRCGAEFVNCTIVGNRSAADIPQASGISAYSSLFTVENTIIWGNRYGNGLADDQPGSGGEGAQINLASSSLTIGQSLVEGWSGLLGGTGNGGADPLFVDESNGDLHVLAGSPAIDGGANAALPDLPLDLDGLPRVADGDGDGVAVVDIGVYEFPGDPTGVREPGRDMAGLFLTVGRAAGQVGFDYRLPSEATVALEVFDLRGRRLRILASGRLPAGEHHAEWDGTDAGGRRVASGIYLARLRADAADLTRRFVVLR